MKRILIVILGIGVVSAIACLFVANRLTERHAGRLAQQQAIWEAERATLEAALAEAQSRPPEIVTLPATPVGGGAQAPSGAKLTPTAIMAKLAALKSAPANHSRTARQAIHWMEELIAAGPDALPAIRQFLARNDDIEFAPGTTTGGRPQGPSRAAVPNDFVVPPTLRFGLFDVVKQIGGDQAEQVLADVLASTGRGIELAWLARALEEMAPSKYRDTALSAAHTLLARPANPSNPLDRNDRDQLFSVLSMYGDTSYVSTAQSQLLRADGELDRSALKYLQQTLGPQAVPIVAQLFEDPRITDPARKEPFARLALNYVGADPQANQFYQKAINDMTLTPSHRKNLIEDLNQDGFADTRNLGQRDLPLIQNRISLIEQLAPHATDPANIAAFKEAYKDLINMQKRVLSQPAP